jgi:hypothetical protein
MDPDPKDWVFSAMLWGAFVFILILAAIFIDR